MRNLIRLLVSRAMRTVVNVPRKCFAVKYVIPDNDICDCIDKCKYDSPNWVNWLPTL